MDKKLFRLMEPGVRLQFFALLVFACLSFLYSWKAAVFELLIVLAMYLFYRRALSIRRREIMKYVESLTLNVDTAAKDSIVNFPLPMVVVNVETGNIIWCNDHFFSITGSHEHVFEVHISDVVPGFDTRWVMEGKSLCPYDVTVRERTYAVYGNLVRSKYENARGRGLLITLFWVDTTDYKKLRAEYERTRPVVSIICIDSYEEVLKNLSDSDKSGIQAQIDTKINEWLKDESVVIRKYDRDRYILLCEEQTLEKFIDDKFSVLASVREIKNSEDIPVTLSIGIGRDGETLKEKYQFANLATDMALSRGGDQAVIKSRFAFEFFGGATKEVEKRTKVKSRVMANALSQLMKASSLVLIMGHRVSDIDSIGAAAGMVCAARKREKNVKIVVNEAKTSAASLIARLRTMPEYENVFISPEDALLMADKETLLIVVDTNRPDFVESPELLQAAMKVAVIDHHRRAADYIENAAINMHEPYASSASELSCELLQYMVSAHDVARVEAEALLAGIYLDTKGYTIKTGVRTFEAAAYLRRAGADTIEVKRLFQNDFDDQMTKYRIVTASHIYRDSIAIAVADYQVPRAIAAQAADELLTIHGVHGSFVVFKNDGETIISARSLGQLNVQVITEKLGGGGNITTAGAQPGKVPVEDVVANLKRAIDEVDEARRK